MGSLCGRDRRCDAPGAGVRRVAASVPGCVHTDLLAAGLIPDPHVDDNKLVVSWVGRTDWRYVTIFDWRWGRAERHELLFDGLDAVATVAPNGTVLGRTANMHRRYRYDVTELLADAYDLAIHARGLFRDLCAFVHRLDAAARISPTP